MYVSFILVKHLSNLTVSFQILIAFVNNANAKDKNHAIIYKMTRLPIILLNGMFFSYVKSTLE